jgi:hypothetical protein
LPRRASKALSLVGLQRWFASEIFRPNLQPPRRRPARSPRAAEVVLPSRTLTAAERVAIYSRMYFARLHDCLADDYPTIFKFLGPEAFGKLVRSYLSRYPSRHYSLNDLGRRMPRFLAGAARVRRRALLQDVARLELSMSRVFDAAESPVLEPRQLSKLPPAEWQKARLRLVEALELLPLDYPVNALVTAARQDKELPHVPRRRSWVAVYRKKYAVWRMDLTEPMYVLLSALASGKTILDAIRAASRVWGSNPGRLEKSISAWFAEWVREGLFSAVVLGGRGSGRASWKGKAGAARARNGA